MEQKESFLLRLPITVYFIPTTEGEVVFNLKCDVKRKTQPLSLNIKATSYSMNVSVGCQDSDGHVIELSAHKINVIDLKEVSSTGSLNHLLHKALQDCTLTRSFADRFQQKGKFSSFMGTVGSQEGGRWIFHTGH